MKLITEIDNDEEFLKALYKSAETVDECLTKTEIMQIRQNKPDFEGHETEEEKQAMLKEQLRKNLLGMAKNLLEDKPEYTLKLLRSLIVLEPGEEYPKRLKLISMGLKALTSDEVIDFFVDAISLVTILSNK